MENKTCGECKWFVLNSEGRCRSNEGEENANNDCCSFFEPKVITNGDVIRQMSDEELAELLTNPPCFICSKGDAGGECTDTWVKKNCKEAIIVRLNAPAESEVNNAGAKGIIIEDRGLYKMMAFEESYIDLKNPISIEQRNTSPAEDTLKAALQDMCELWESIGKQIPPLLNEQKYLNARNLAGNATDVPAKESEGNNGEK